MLHSEKLSEITLKLQDEATILYKGFSKTLFLIS